MHHLIHTLKPRLNHPFESAENRCPISACAIIKTMAEKNDHRFAKAADIKKLAKEGDARNQLFEGEALLRWARELMQDFAVPPAKFVALAGKLDCQIMRLQLSPAKQKETMQAIAEKWFDEMVKEGEASPPLTNPWKGAAPAASAASAGVM